MEANIDQLIVADFAFYLYIHNKLNTKICTFYFSFYFAL